MKRIISLITTLSILMSFLVIPHSANAAYEYKWTLTKHGFKETIFDGQSVYKIAPGTVNEHLFADLSKDDDGNSIPAQSMVYMRISYYLDAKTTSNVAGKSKFYIQYNTLSVDGTSTTAATAGISGFKRGANDILSTTKEWCELNMSLKALNDYANNAENKNKEIYLKKLQIIPYHTLTLADDETLYIKDITIYTVDPTTETGSEHTVTFYSDDSKSEVVSSGKYKSGISDYAAKITMPASPTAKEGFTFMGWRKTGSDTVYKAGEQYTFIDGANIDFCAVWMADEIYVSSTGDDAAFGTSNAPVASLKRAVELLGADRGGKIWIDGSVEYKDVPAHTKKITISTKTTGTVTATDGIKLSGETAFEGVTVSGAVSTYTNPLTMKDVTAKEVALGGDMSVGGNGVTPEPETATLDGGTYTTVYLGGEDTTKNYGTYSKANTLYVKNNATVDTLYLGHSTTVTYGQLIAGDVNIVVDNSTVKSFTDSGRVIGWIAGAVQVLANYASTVNPSVATSKISFGQWYMNSDSSGGLDPTDIEGTFAVRDNKTAVATNTATSKVYYSANGKLKVPAGTYSVTYKEDPVYTYSGDMTALTVNTTFKADFETIEHKETDGKLFVGWKYSDGTAVANGDTIAAGKVLTAHYTNFAKNDFYVEKSAQIRQASENEDAALRFIVRRNNDVNIPNAEFGTVVLPKIIVKYNELVVDGEYEFPYGSGNYVKAEKVKAVNNYVQEEDYTKYTLCLTGIPEEEYIRVMTVRGYVLFTDYNGLKREAYTDKVDISMFETAEAENRTDLMSACRTAYESHGRTEIPYDENWQTDAMETGYMENYGGTRVIETTVDSGADLKEPVEILFFSDMHFRYMNDTDKENAEAMSAFGMIAPNINPISRHYQSAQAFMEYADLADYVMFGGDMIDFFSYGSLDLVKDVMFDKSPESIGTPGYHDYVLYTMNHRPSNEFSQANAKATLAESYFGHNVTYHSYDIPNSPIRIVQVDNSRNGQHYHSDLNHEKLLADVEDARAKGKKILIITHEDTCTNIENQGMVPEFLHEGGTLLENEFSSAANDCWFNPAAGTTNYDQVKGTKAFYEVLFHNSDVIRGIFHGHLHSNHVTEIAADYTDADGKVIQKTIPQYSSDMNGNYNYGFGVKIIVK